ncbi:MAG: hypothetical protein COU47_00725 [Candidatus Niyogibacteria bacterium CG10_big_fil_rev_8_21_14_0_10_46_36]|uniref:Glycosyltransferase 2-like domain-containing protein n=1 Tax=Candidatus Niyogibacteria bacterium CG10_big_fil_rev_8_21_14_0_10_46_36 TaxID=1974726 RepID=A0A2H0TEH0_9BACT|nr:MAG: hypothetical protein COU47_00725 [Candidatus Niyogibacteria bacterium CG10_big_fil_rev_8_21_14_0_10_46_36]
MTHEPLISIGLPVYNSVSRENGEKELCRALDSLLAQTHARTEIIISDNASSDSTDAICTAYAARDSRIRYIRHTENKGQVANISFVIREARGSYFMLASDDDVWEKNFIELLLAALEAHPEYQVAMGSFDRFYDDGVFKDSVRLTGNLHTTHQTPYAIYEKLAFDAPLHIYLYGLFRTAFIQRAFLRNTPECIRWDRPMLAELALATPFYAVPDKVFTKQYKKTVGRIRYANEQIGHVYTRPFSFSIYVWMFLWRPITSPVVPLQRKIGFVPIWIRFVFWSKKRIAKDMWQACKRAF